MYLKSKGVRVIVNDKTENIKISKKTLTLSHGNTENKYKDTTDYSDVFKSTRITGKHVEVTLHRKTVRSIITGTIK